MQRRFIIIAAILGFFGVALGAFGAHGLRAIFEANGRGDTFQTATEYQMIHALALLAVALLSSHYPGKHIQWAGVLFLIGVGLFSGSLYILSIFDLGFMGAVAPFGGVALLGGWFCLGWAAFRVDK
jgi:uncharacterized membrane protein YgdD (TMEM256/DUF423 family)